MWATYSGLLSVYPLATKSATGSVLYSLSDGIAQKATAGRKDAASRASRDEETPSREETPREDVEVDSDIDRGRVARFAVWGVVDAFMTTRWYATLGGWTEAAFGARARAASASSSDGGVDWPVVAFEVAADQLVYCPIWFVAFFAFGGAWERRPAAETWRRMREEMGPAIATSWWTWVPVMTFSFARVPNELRVPYYLAASFAYAMLLSALWGEVGGGGDGAEGRRGDAEACDDACVAGAALGALTMEAVSGSFEEAQGAEDGAEDG